MNRNLRVKNLFVCVEALRLRQQISAMLGQSHPILGWVTSTGGRSLKSFLLNKDNTALMKFEPSSKEKPFEIGDGRT